MSDEQINRIIDNYASIVSKTGIINDDLFVKYDVKRGLRDISGTGVLVGLTEISEIFSYIIEDDEYIPCEGKLFYRGIDIEHIVQGFFDENRFGFEEICFLLLFGHLPGKTEYNEFKSILDEYADLPENFVRNVIMNAPSRDTMNSLARSVLTLYSYDDNPDDPSPENVIRQLLKLIARFPLLAVYGCHSYMHVYKNQSLLIHAPEKGLSIAENILLMLRPEGSYTNLEARILDLALVLHAEHGGGNNATFTTHVVTSTLTDTYSTIAAALGSLKGPRNGGANIRVMHMFRDMQVNISDWHDDDEISVYLEKILNREAFDKSGIIYGIGHAFYSLSDPRALILRRFVEQLAAEKNRMDEYVLYSKVEYLAPRVIGNLRRMYKGVSANIDFYSGFIYSMLDLPEEIFTPLFAVARIAGWSAHRLEELVNAGKIIRPDYKSVAGQTTYVPMNDRK